MLFLIIFVFGCEAKFYKLNVYNYGEGNVAVDIKVDALIDKVTDVKPNTKLDIPLIPGSVPMNEDSVQEGNMYQAL
jgi:hypothetical protein